MNPTYNSKKMALETIDLILIFVYFAILILIGYLASRKQTPDEYLIAERKLGSWSTMATINASKTGSILMVFVALTFLWGFSALWYFIGIIAGIFLFLPFALRLKQYSEEKYYTLADYFKDKHGKKVAILASLLTIFLMFGVMVLNIIAGSKIFVFFTSWPFWLCATITVVIVMIYLLLGGYDAVVKTDRIQYVAMIFIITAITFAMFNGSIIPASDWYFFSADFTTMFGFFLIGILYPFAMPELWQRVYSAKDKKTLKKGLLISVVFYGFVALMMGLVALTIKAKFPNIDPDLALVYGFNQVLPAGLLGLALVLLFAAIMSSLDTYTYTGASAIVQDFFTRTKRTTVRMIKKYIIILSIISLIVSILVQDLVIGSYLFVSFATILATVAIATWIKNDIKQRTLIWGTIVGLAGLITYLVISLMKGDVQPTIVIVGFASTLIGLGMGRIISFFR